MIQEMLPLGSELVSNLSLSKSAILLFTPPLLLILHWKYRICENDGCPIKSVSIGTADVLDHRQSQSSTLTVVITTTHANPNTTSKYADGASQLQGCNRSTRRSHDHHTNTKWVRVCHMVIVDHACRLHQRVADR